MTHFLLKHFLGIQEVFAQGGIGNQGGGIGNSGLEPTKSLQEILDSITAYAIGLGLTIASLMIIYAAYQMITAGASPDQFESGKKTIMYAVIGVIVLLLSAAIIALIKEIIGVR